MIFGRDLGDIRLLLLFPYAFSIMLLRSHYILRATPWVCFIVFFGIFLHNGRAWLFPNHNHKDYPLMAWDAGSNALLNVSHYLSFSTL